MQGLGKGADDSAEGFARIEAVAPIKRGRFSADEQLYRLGRDSSR